jgi:hypothetical protein
LGKSHGISQEDKKKGCEEMTKYEVLTVMYSLEELLKIEDKNIAAQKALNVISKVIKEAESTPKTSK